ncbi:MAG: TlyA family RNA methyltransferase [Anaerolineales bacterium]|nr:TlyA family RNA methyltransferase [Anaerolineales bacterium]MCW5855876.1 TlyA family RNA methyltransferase [Anaerolineales bacterium]
MSKQRADELLVARGLADSRSQAQRLVMAGQVRANGQVVAKPSSQLASDSQLEVDHGPKYVSRGGEKLEAALAQFEIAPKGWSCADVGASTGGFSDCLLQTGAARIYAIDVGKGQLHWRLRLDPRIIVMEATNARHLERLPEQVDLIVVDVSFISLKVILPVVRSWLALDGQLVALIKPQFEAGKQEVARGKGVIRDAEVHQRVLNEVLEFVSNDGYQLRGLMRSPILGPKGNQEFLLWADCSQPAGHSPEALIAPLFTAGDAEAR